jgi:predicted nucleic acid-binding protein
VRPRYLIDTSALLRVERRPEVAKVVGPLLAQGSVAICAPILLEVMYSAKATEYDKALRALRTAMTVLPLSEASCDRSVEVQRLLARRSQHRTAKAPDLLIAACAEVNDLTVLHYDKDYDAIAAVTGQPVKWVVPAGSVA